MRQLNVPNTTHRTSAIATPIAPASVGVAIPA
jgi:hypothetical protein